MIVDTDILSQLSKINKISLLHQVFGKGSIRISLEVYQELLIARERGFFFIEPFFKEHFTVLSLDQELIQEYEFHLNVRATIHSGELSSILLCRKYDEPFLSNDKKAHQFCDSIGVVWLDICDILSIAYGKEIFSREQILTTVTEIEEMDRTRISNPERIFVEL